jgi:signal transduction histidine kinase
MTSLVENLLSLARAHGGAETITLAPIQFNCLFHIVEEAWNNAMNRAMLDFRVEMPDDHLVLLGDKHGIIRLLSILLENAAKYTPPGGSVTLSAGVEGTRVLLSVHDTGVGIATEDKPRIFDRFYRAAPPGESLPSGSGLGLALGKWIAERHGTELHVDSDPGRGSCFTFCLNRHTPAFPVIDAFRASNAHSAAEHNRPSSQTH